VRRALTWLVTLPISLGGVEFGHALINAIAGSPTGLDGELFQRNGPGGGLGPLVASIAVGMVLLGLSARIAGIGGDTSGVPLSPLPYACVAPLAFIVQEHVETVLHTGQLSLSTVRDPTFLPGLALQVPFALLAYLIARVLLRVADVVHRRIARARLCCSARLRGGVWFGVRSVASPRPRSSSACSGRAPPGGLAAAA
jgi:hypothetical protein